MTLNKFQGKEITCERFFADGNGFVFGLPCGRCGLVVHGLHV